MRTWAQAGAKKSRLKWFLMTCGRESKKARQKKSSKKAHLPQHEQLASEASGTEIEEPILFYERDQPFYDFTNFSEHAIQVGTVEYSTAEAAFQVNKFENPKHRQAIQQCKTAREALNTAQRLKEHRRKDWFEISIDRMRAVVALKIAQHPDVRDLLLGTGKAPLIEASPVDDFWGIGKDGNGQNWRELCFLWKRAKCQVGCGNAVGKIWMETRARLRIEEIGNQGDIVQHIVALYQ